MSDAKTPQLRAQEEWMRQYGIVGHGGYPDQPDKTTWALEIPDNAQIQVHMMVTLPDGRQMNWGGSNMAGRYELTLKSAEVADAE